MTTIISGQNVIRWAIRLEHRNRLRISLNDWCPEVRSQARLALIPQVVIEPESRQVIHPPMRELVDQRHAWVKLDWEPAVRRRHELSQSDSHYLFNHALFDCPTCSMTALL